MRAGMKRVAATGATIATLMGGVRCGAPKPAEAATAQGRLKAKVVKFVTEAKGIQGVHSIEEVPGPDGITVYVNSPKSVLAGKKPEIAGIREQVQAALKKAGLTTFNPDVDSVDKASFNLPTGHYRDTALVTQALVLRGPALRGWTPQRTTPDSGKQRR